MSTPPRVEAAGAGERASHSTIRFGFAAVAICILLLTEPVPAQTAYTDWASVDARLTSLLSGNNEQKRTALSEIRGLQTERASRLAVPALSDTDEIVRATAAASVIFLPENEARQALLPLLADKRPFVRREAAYALGSVGSRAATGDLRRVMTGDRDLEVRAAAAIAIGSIGDHSALDDLLALLSKRPKEEEEFLRRSAARSIGQIFELQFSGDTKSVTPQNFLPARFKNSGSVSAPSNWIEPQRAERIAATLAKVLGNRDEADDTRREAAFAIGATRLASAVTALSPHQHSPDPYLAEITKEALLKIENSQLRR